MKLPGYCTVCRRFRQVSVSGAEIARVAALGRPAHEGVCSDCEDARQRRVWGRDPGTGRFSAATEGEGTP